MCIEFADRTVGSRSSWNLALWGEGRVTGINDDGNAFCANYWQHITASLFKDRAG
jgi:hypothetical protein